MSKCPTCFKARCSWVNLKAEPQKLSTEELNEVYDHNISYIEMTFRGHQGSANAEERLYEKLGPYAEEIENRKAVQ